jgi:diguanylate cyclase (GGDEF)-like protein
MPSPGDPADVSKPAEDSFLELMAETLENMDRGPRGQFLQRFFKAIAQVDLTEVVSLDYWDQILQRQRELSDTLGKPFPLKTAMVEVLASSSYLRLPVLMEYEELKKLQISAATDPLTGLYNRRFFEEHFEKELNRAMRYNQHLALVLLDLHQFKEVNDRYGHPRGDLLLQTAASTLRKSLRTSDYAFRIGGDEFALLLLQSDTEQAMTLARRLRANFTAIVEPMQMAVALGLDYGVAVYPADGDQKEVLIRIADERLYEMKHSQRPATVEPYFPPARRPATPSPSSPEVAPQVPEAKAARRSYPEQRKWERVSLVGTRAYAQLANDPQRSVRVLDLGYGGVALETAAAEEIAPSFFAVLHVPILPPVRVSLKRLYQLPLEGGRMRVGCSFVT